MHLRLIFREFKKKKIVSVRRAYVYIRAQTNILLFGEYSFQRKYITSVVEYMEIRDPT